MALVLADRVKETTTSTGTTAITLAGAPTGYQTFLAAIGDANTTYYTIADQSGANWEVGIGTYTTSGNTLSRDTVLASSNSGSLVTFTSGTKDVFVTYPAERALYSGGTLGTPTSGTLTNCTGLPLSTGITGTLAVADGGTGVTTATGSGSVVLNASPTLTGTPLAPTAAAGTNTTQIATTAFVATNFAALKGTATVYGGAKFSLSGTTLTITTT